MNRSARCYTAPVALALLIAGSAQAAPPATYPFTWSTVVNNGDYLPTDLCDPSIPTANCVHFNSYNQPSVNAERLVVMRARSRGGHGQGEPIHGIYTRDMAAAGPIVRILERRATAVPQPNNRGTTFGEPPSFPRIDINTATLATRGNHRPVWQVISNGEIVEQLGTNGIYTNPYGALITGASKLGNVADFSFFQVPELPGTRFDVFPGAPAVTDGHVIVFKGNYTVGNVGKTGVYYRDLTDAPIPVADTDLAPAGGTEPVVLIANNTDSLIPGTSSVFGSTAPPSAADHRAVFSGFDNEESPTLGGIYLADLDRTTQPPLKTLVSIGGQVPGENGRTRFNKLGEGLSFDGRFVAFWGAWGNATKTLILQCPNEGNAGRIAYCRALYPNGAAVQVPVHQGIFVHDIRTGHTHLVTKTLDYFDDFLYWNFSGHVPGSTEEEDGEPARWRSSAFAAVSGMVGGSLDDAIFHVAFKGRKGDVSGGAYVDPVDGIYLARGPGNSRISPVVTSGMNGTLLDPRAVDADTGAVLPVTEMGIERDGFRGNALVINATMGSEETGWSGVYLTEVSE